VSIHYFPLHSGVLCTILLLLVVLVLVLIPLSLRTEHRASTVPRHPRLLFQFLGSIRHLVGLLGGGYFTDIDIINLQICHWKASHNTESHDNFSLYFLKYSPYHKILQIELSRVNEVYIIFHGFSLRNMINLTLIFM
jgi:hypothetical protein